MVDLWLDIGNGSPARGAEPQGRHRPRDRCHTAPVANGEKKSFALLRPVSDVAALDSVRTLIVEAYTAQVATAEPAE